METNNAIHDILTNYCGLISINKGYFDGHEAFKIRLPKADAEYYDVLIIIDGAQIKIVDKTLDVIAEETIIQLADPEMIDKLLSTVNPILDRARTSLGHSTKKRPTPWNTITQKN